MRVPSDDEDENRQKNQDDQWCDDDLLSHAYDAYLSQSQSMPTAIEKVAVNDLSTSTSKVEKASKRSTENNEQSPESEEESLFGGDFSDDDPSYLPTGANCSAKSDSEDSELIQVDELLNPENYLTKQQNIKIMRSKAIASLFGKDVKKYDKNNESQFIAQEIVADLFKQTWKIIKPRARWSRKDPGNWKKNVAKRRRAEGLPYNTAKKCRDPKVPKPINCSMCKFDCNDHISENIRKELCRKYWSLEYVPKKQFLLSHVEVKPTRRLLLDRKRPTMRNYTKKCFFIVDGEKKYVCQDFFCKTLCISPYVISDAIKNRNSLGQYSLEQDPRGRREPPNKTSPEAVEAVKNHIASFPCMESHYVRKKLKRKYLDAGLTLGKMYSLYVEDCKSKNTEPTVSEMTYRRIFCTEFNLGFYMPKKDQCLLCTKFNRASDEEKTKLQKEFDEHKQRKEKCNREKELDKERAENETDFLSISFDLQAILQIPSTDVGLLYYVRKLTVYNLTIYENALPNAAYCFVWNEVHGKKGSAEIGTILHYYLTTCVAKEIKQVSLFSDTCGGQNRNQHVAAILLWIMMQDTHQLEVIEHKLLESGHSYMEADSMHSAIETSKKNCDIFCMRDWVNVFKRARAKEVYKRDKKKVIKKPYNVKEYKYYEFKDLKALANAVIKNRKKTSGETVNWLKIKRMKYIKGDNRIFYNYDMSNDFMTIDVTALIKTDTEKASTTSLLQTHGYATRNKRQHQQQYVDDLQPPMQSTNSGVTFPPLQQLYSAPLPIAKKKDLISLCNKGVIPEEYHGWFHSLPTEVSAVDRCPDATVSDDDTSQSSEE